MNNLTVFNNELIPVYTTDKGNKVVYGRDLHTALEIATPYSMWFKRMSTYGDFKEGENFFLVQESRADGKAGKPKKNHIMSLNMAKVAAQMQRTQKGLEIADKLSKLQGEPKTEDKNNQLTVFSTDLIPVYTTDNGEKVVLGRELHERLKIGQDYSSWFVRICEDYYFKENSDYYSYFTVFPKFRENCKIGGRPQKDHILKVRMAKEIAMIQRTPEGKAIRKKLLELEELASKGELSAVPSWQIKNEIERAEAWAKEARKLLALTEENKALQAHKAKLEQENKDLELGNTYLGELVDDLQPKADGYDEFIELGECLGVQDTANLLGVKLSEFVGWLEAEEFVYRGGDNKLRGKAEYLDKAGNKNQWFDEKIVDCPNDPLKRQRRQMVITPKGQDAFRKMLKGVDLSQYKRKRK